MKEKLVLGMALILIIVSVDLIHHQHILPQFFIAPDGQTIANQFANSVVSGNLDLATDLTDGSEACKQSMLKTLEDYSTYEGSEIDEIVANGYVFTDRPSEGFINVLVLLKGEGDMEGEGFTARLKTNYTVLGKRFTCGVTFPDS